MKGGTRRRARGRWERRLDDARNQLAWLESPASREWLRRRKLLGHWVIYVTNEIVLYPESGKVENQTRVTCLNDSGEPVQVIILDDPPPCLS